MNESNDRGQKYFFLLHECPNQGVIIFGSKEDLIRANSEPVCRKRVTAGRVYPPRVLHPNNGAR